jgi:UDP-2-acetamido-2,6-beta-L-arabino-hexul-4-ose reductase
MERFLVLKGAAEIRVRELLSSRIHTFAVEGASPRYVDIPTFHTHTITNTGREELLTLFWTTELFNPEDPDTFAEKVNR